MDVPQLTRELRKHGLRPSRIKSTVHYVQRFGFEPDYVIDVGVFHGTPYLYRAFPHTKFVLIDPLRESREAIAAKGGLKDYDFHELALSDQEGEAPFQVTTTQPGRGGNLSSLHARADRVQQRITDIETRTVPLARLDTVADAYPGKLGLKVDAEGHELGVLSGAPETLKRCEFVILELSLTQRFDLTPPPSAIFAALAAAGLEFRDVFDSSSPVFDMPRHVDILFTRWPAPAPAATAE